HGKGGGAFLIGVATVGLAWGAHDGHDGRARGPGARGGRRGLAEGVTSPPRPTVTVWSKPRRSWRPWRGRPTNPPRRKGAPHRAGSGPGPPSYPRRRTWEPLSAGFRLRRGPGGVTSPLSRRVAYAASLREPDHPPGSVVNRDKPSAGDT